MKTTILISVVFLAFIVSFVQFNQVQSFVSSAYAQSENDGGMTEEGGLDLGSVEIPKEAIVDAHEPWWHLALTIFLILLLLGLVYFSPRIANLFSRGREKGFSYDIGTLPLVAKVAITIQLATYGLVHILAVLDVYMQSQVIAKTAYEYFFYMKVGRLLGLSHAHLFGHAAMYALVILPFLFTKLKEVWKIRIVSAALLAAVFDVGSWWAIKYTSNILERLSMVCGMLVSIGFTAMALTIFYEMWLKKERKTL